MSFILGRDKESSLLAAMLKSPRAEFLALYGRRRVGKTHLIREYFNNKALYCEITGLKDGSMKEQLLNFRLKIEAAFSTDVAIPTPANWQQAFHQLTGLIEAIDKEKQIVIFLDELPWLATKRSKLLQNLDYYWNSYWSRHKNFKLIVCGSAASWILDNLINAKGGLHNRITQTMLLEPFTLLQTQHYLQAMNIQYNQKQIVDIYMVMGGVPHYLNHLKKNLSAAQNIDEMCFRKQGLLYDEFNRLFAALFDSANEAIGIVRAIASKPQGISRMELLKKVKAKSGGTFNKKIAELIAAGFISGYIPYGNKAKEQYFRIEDPYTLFYLKWIEPVATPLHSNMNAPYWLAKMKSPDVLVWAGFAFEQVCYKHIANIKKALNLNDVACKIGTWRISAARKNLAQSGAQVDLLFDRDDGVITLCEIKYSQSPLVIDKSYAKNLMNKVDLFEKFFSTTKQINFALITLHGVKANAWAEELVSAEVMLADLFVGS